VLITQRTPLLDRVRQARRHFGPRRVPPGAMRWLACFTAISTVLLVRNAYLFTAKVYEDSDFAANTIAVLQAKHFQLLTGNYSRLGFYHPGPAFLYVEAWGEWLFHDVTHLVPTPWNGQLLAILLLNAALLATAVSAFARDGGTVVATACLGTVLAFTVLHPLTVNSSWFPYVYFAPTLLLLVSAAAVAAGRTASVPLLCFAAGLCIHGHAEFLFFAPIMVLAALAGLFAPHWRNPQLLFRASRRHWLAALAITLVMALPIAVNTIVNWPGQLPKYFDYGVQANGNLHHTAGIAVGYTLRFWWPGGPERGGHPPEEMVAAIGGFLVALLVLWLVMSCRHLGQRRFLLWALAMVALITVLFTYYAWRAIDGISVAYEGYFYWAAPLLLLLVGSAALAPQIQLAARRLVVPLLTAGLAVAAVAASVVPLRAEPDGPGQYFGDPGIPHDVAVMAALSRGRPVVLDVSQVGWGDAIGVIAYADRISLRACVSEPSWTIQFRAQSICTPAELRDGTTFAFVGNQQQPHPTSRPLFAMLSSEVFRVSPAEPR
jgi:hypothetical protein